MATLVSKLFDALASLWLSCVLLFLMFVLTFLGTIAQASVGLYLAQKLYFESFFVYHEIRDLIVLPLPGGYLVMLLLAINLLVGGVVRMRWTLSRFGVLITHVGIAMLLLAGVVKFYLSSEGRIALTEQTQTAEYVSYHDWEIAISEVRAEGGVREFAVLTAGFEGVDSATLSSDELPFELTVDHYYPNSKVVAVDEFSKRSHAAVDGFALEPKLRASGQESNIAGCRVEVRVAGGESQAGILWGWRSRQQLTTLPAVPWTVTVGERQFGIDLRKRRLPLPFALRLDETRRAKHPGTGMASKYESDVTVLADEVEQPILIKMNKPLRRDGFIAFQSSWGRLGNRQNGPLYSGFAVVNNPSDQWPLWSSVVIGVGLLWHFGRQLLRFIIGQARARA